jgi:hypothetical protein
MKSKRNMWRLVWGVLVLLAAVEVPLLAGDDAAAAHGVATNASATNAASADPLRFLVEVPTNSVRGAVPRVAGAAAGTNRWDVSGVQTASVWRTTAELEVGYFHLRERCSDGNRRDVNGWYQGVEVGLQRDISSDVTIGLGLGVGRTSTRFP